MSSNFESLALARYPGNENKERRKDYIRALQECQTNPAYSMMTPMGIYLPCTCEPYMEDDTKGWQRVKKGKNHC
jgi:hypothetical protein